MSIAIQLHINRLHLPKEMLDTINSYLFYDTKTYHIIQNAKTQKQITNNLINSAQMSRANKFNNHPSYSDDEEFWSFGFSANHLTEDLQLQAINCYFCGNYIQHEHYFELNYSNCIYCICPPHYDFTEDDLYSHNNGTDDEIDEVDWYHEDYDY